METSIFISVLIVGISTVHAIAALREKDARNGERKIRLFVFFLICSFLLAIADIYYKWEKEQKLEVERQLDKTNSLRNEEEARLRHEEVLRNINRQLVPFNLYYSEKSGVLEETKLETVAEASVLIDINAVQSSTGFLQSASEEKGQPKEEDTRVPVIEEVVYPEIEMEASSCKDLNTTNGSVYGVVKFINRTKYNLEIFRGAFYDNKFIRVNSGRSGVTQRLQVSVLDREGNFSVSTKEHEFYFSTVEDGSKVRYGKMFVTAKACKQITIEISDYNLTLTETKPR